MKKILIKILVCSQIVTFLLPLNSVYGQGENDIPKNDNGIETNKPINLVNGNFEEPIISDSSYVQFTEDKVPGWRTTASDKLIEIQANGLDNITAYSGRQWAELIAAEPSALYQDIETKPGSYVYWEVAHKARLDHTDIAAVKFGAPNGTLETQAIMSTGKENWKVYSGYYKIPKGQNITRFQFESLSGSTNLIGNLIDNVKFTSEYHGSNIIVEYKDIYGNTLIETETFKGPIGKEYDISYKDIPFYSLDKIEGNPKGVYTEKDQRVTFIYKKIKGKPVTIKYEDEEGNKLADSEVLSGELGDSYETKAKEIKGWRVKQLPENAQGIYSDQAQEVVYVYERVEGEGVTVRYEDEEGNKLADSEILKGKYGLPYETKAKEIKGWKVKQLPENAQGIYSDQAQEVVYVYVPIKNMGFELQKPISTVEKNKVGKYQKYPQTGEKITNKFFEIGLSLVMASVAILVLKYKKDI
ncbi:MucBP domain-containing protein [Enterococcus faecalis]